MLKRFIAFVFLHKIDVKHGWSNVVRDETGKTASWDTKEEAWAAAREKEQQADKRWGWHEIQVVDLHTGEDAPFPT